MVRGMNSSLELYWSFRSPYSYLVTGRIVEIERAYELQVNVRPVYAVPFDYDGPMWARVR